MRQKISLVLGVVMVSIFFGSVATAQDVDDVDPVDTLLDDVMSLCVDDACSSIWLPPTFPGVSLEDDPFEFIDTQGSEDPAEEDEAAPEEGGALDWLSYGDCTYVDSYDGDYISCLIDFPVPSPYYNVAVGTVPEGDAIVMCYYNESTDEWDVAGFSEFGDSYKLIVEGQDDFDEAIAIIRGAVADDNCPTGTFTQRFDYTVSSSRSLRVRGNGGTDYIYGSQWGDLVLSGERVYGREGNDYLYLHNDGVTYPAGYGGKGADNITGCTAIDYVWGDDSNSEVYSDVIYGGDNADQLTGVGGNDTVYGENGNDTLWGEDGDDILVPGANSDTCYGGNGDDDRCYDCETWSSCDPTP